MGIKSAKTFEEIAERLSSFRVLPGVESRTARPAEGAPKAAPADTDAPRDTSTGAATSTSSDD